jgi:molecular chaperone GrpE
MALIVHMNKKVDKSKPKQQPKQDAHKEAQENDSQKSEKRMNLVNQFEELKDKLTHSQEREKRALADYQNLLRRTKQERSKAARMANKDLIVSLLPILENLDRAADEINNQGLDLVVDQLWKTLNQYGLKEIEVKNQPFDVETMEVVDKKGEGKIVTEVVQKGFRLKGDVIQHAKVILGRPTKDN